MDHFQAIPVSGSRRWSGPIKGPRARGDDDPMRSPLPEPWRNMLLSVIDPCISECPPGIVNDKGTAFLELNVADRRWLDYHVPRWANCLLSGPKEGIG